MTHFQNPPSVNGVMQLTDMEKQTIKDALLQIESEFVPTIDEPTLSIHGLVSRYNQANETKINGDTAQMCLAWSVDDAGA